MKRNTNIKKLGLQSATLKQLTVEGIAGVAGGTSGNVFCGPSVNCSFAITCNCPTPYCGSR
jgi:hypothetical protein